MSCCYCFSCCWEKCLQSADQESERLLPENVSTASYDAQAQTVYTSDSFSSPPSDHNAPNRGPDLESHHPIASSQKPAYLKSDPAHPGLVMFNEPQHETVTSKTQMPIKGNGIDISITGGAVREGTTLTIQSFVGGNIDPEGFRLKSPMYAVSSSDEIQGNVQMTLHHFANLKSEDDCRDMTIVTVVPKAGRSGLNTIQVLDGAISLFKPEVQTATVELQKFPVGPIATARKNATTDKDADNKYSVMLFKSVQLDLSHTSKPPFAVFTVCPDHGVYMKMCDLHIQEKYGKLEITKKYACFTLNYVEVVLDDKPDDCIIIPDIEPTTIYKEDIDQLIEPLDSGTDYIPPMIVFKFTFPQPLRQQVVCRLEVKGLNRKLIFPVLFQTGLQPTAVPHDTDHCSSATSIQQMTCNDKDVPKDVLSTNDLKVLMRLLHDVVTKWYEIGLELGFPDADLEIIRTNLTPGGVVSMFREMLRLWLRWAPPAHSCPTIGALCKALQGPSVSNERLAAQLEERFKSQQEDTDHCSSASIQQMTCNDKDVPKGSVCQQSQEESKDVEDIATELQEQAMKWEDNEMVQIVREIAGLMKNAESSMREHDVTTNQLVNNLIDKSRKIVRMANKIADNCKDAKISEELKKHTSVVTNFSTQLSHIASLSSRLCLTDDNVKLNATNLLKAIGEVLNRAEIATLETHPGSGHLDWKRRSIRKRKDTLTRKMAEEMEDAITAAMKKPMLTT